MHRRLPSARYPEAACRNLLRALLGAVVALNSGCAQEEAKGERALILRASPSQINGDGVASALLTIQALEADGAPGTGAAIVVADSGDLDGQFRVRNLPIELTEGKATVAFSCDVSKEPECRGSQRIVAHWKGLTSSTKVLVSYTEPCTEDSKLIYLVDWSGSFMSFDPGAVRRGADPFKELGSLDCPAPSEAHPFSMSVDHLGVAWVLFDNGHLFTVSTSTRPLRCRSTSYVPDATLSRFGMGFVSDAPGAAEETLFVAGGSDAQSSTLARLRLAPTFSLEPLGTIAGWPELTSAGDGKLWGFFPNTPQPKVAQIDKVTGVDVKVFPVPSLGGEPEAWAFAYAGGYFWIFLKRAADASTGVHRMTPEGVFDTPLRDTGRSIVGAGVSTCATVVN
ncbi:MAG: hypothetical protein HY901_12270 [Deltaproteobacteria bacterium]|nr:hypothetical protein [Deltaproteobacteria bacterium]